MPAGNLTRVPSNDQRLTTPPHTRRRFSLPIAAAVAYAGSDFVAEPTWQPVTAEAVRTQLDEYLQTARYRDRASGRSSRPAGEPTAEDADGDLLDRLAQCLAKADDRVTELDRVLLRRASEPGRLPEFAWLADSETPLLIRHNMRLYLARWLVAARILRRSDRLDRRTR